MKLKVFRISELGKLPEITSDKIIENRKFSKDGLFSLHIFGPILSYHCLCNRNSFKGPNYPRVICPKCGVKIASSSLRSKTYAKIKLPFKVLNPLFFYLASINKITVKRNLLGLLYYNKSVTDNEGRIVYESRNLESIKKYLFDCCKNDKKLSKFLKEHEDLILIDEVLVIPPDLRPCDKIANTGLVLDELNEKYLNIIKVVQRLKSSIIPFDLNKEPYVSAFKTLQRSVFELYDFVFEKLSKKDGLIRSNILGKRVDFSGRAVITPDPTLALNECSLPYLVVLEVLKPKMIPYLVSKRLFKRYNDALRAIDKSLESNDLRFLKELQEFCKGMYCVLNRQPTLHRYSVLAFKVKIHAGQTIKIHPMVCNPYNADFDGDAMAIYFPMTEESLADVMCKISIENNLLSSTNLESIPKANQDIVLGIYSITKNDEPRTLEYKNVKLSEGRYRFNLCLPEDHDVIDKPITKKELSLLFNDICLKYKPDIAIRTLDNIKELGLKTSTEIGYTLSLSDIYSKKLIDYAKKFYTDDLKKDIERLKTDEKLNTLLKELPFAEYIESGSRGSWDQARQLVFSRGYVADSKNAIKGLIKESFSVGLTPKSFFNSCYGTRKGLLDTALSTGESGYLTRQLIYSTIFMTLDESEHSDCKTTDYLKIKVKNENMAYSLLGRYYLCPEEKKLKIVKLSDYKDLIGKTIKLRSPIYCKNKNICKICYGRLHKILHSSQIGIVATQAIGERSTQLVLRTFHISGAVQDVSEDSSSKSHDVIAGMSAIKKLLHNPYTIFLAKKISNLTDTEKTNKKVLLNIKKSLNISPEIIVESMFDILNQFGLIHLIHFEVVVSSMMWCGNKPWRLLENRKEIVPEYVSILKVPSRISWLLACAFSNLKFELLKGVLTDQDELFKPVLLDLFTSDK